MNADYDYCKHEGCKKKVLNKSGLCSEHRKVKCQWKDPEPCEAMVTGRQGGIYCAKHAKNASRRNANGWSVMGAI